MLLQGISRNVEKTLIKPIYHSFTVVYGLVIQGGLYLGISTEFP